jgi:site-specific recombinase XerD
VLQRLHICYSPVYQACGQSTPGRRQSAHTQRAYREDVMAFVKFMGLTWPDHAMELLRASVQDVQRFRGQLLAQNAAPKTLNRRISSLSSFYKYLAAAAAELRLPIIVPNPAHAQSCYEAIHAGQPVYFG